MIKFIVERMNGRDVVEQVEVWAESAAAAEIKIRQMRGPNSGPWVCAGRANG